VLYLAQYNSALGAFSDDERCRESHTLEVASISRYWSY